MPGHPRPPLTLDVEGGVGRARLLPGERVPRQALEGAGVAVPIHGRELQVAALLEALLRVLDGLPVLQPLELHALGLLHLAAEDGAAAVQGVLRVRLFGEKDAGPGPHGCSTHKGGHVWREGRRRVHQVSTWRSQGSQDSQSHVRRIVAQSTSVKSNSELYQICARMPAQLLQAWLQQSLEQGA